MTENPDKIQDLYVIIDGEKDKVFVNTEVWSIAAYILASADSLIFADNLSDEERIGQYIKLVDRATTPSPFIQTYALTSRTSQQVSNSLVTAEHYRHRIPSYAVLSVILRVKTPTGHEVISLLFRNNLPSLV